MVLLDGQSLEGYICIQGFHFMSDVVLKSGKCI